MSVDAKRDTVTAKLTHFSTYALRGAAGAVILLRKKRRTNADSEQKEGKA